MHLRPVGYFTILLSPGEGIRYHMAKQELHVINERDTDVITVYKQSSTQAV